MNRVMMTMQTCEHRAQEQVSAGRTWLAGTLLITLLLVGGTTEAARGQAGNGDMEDDTVTDSSWTRPRKQDAQMERWAAKIVTVYGERELEVGKFENFRVRLRPGAIWPVSYDWHMGDGVRAIGNNVRHAYERPGTYRITAVASNVAGADTASIEVAVSLPPPDVIADDPIASDTQAGNDRQKPVPSNARIVRRDLRSMEAVDLSQGGYTWVVASYLDRWAADVRLRELRKDGYRASIFVDDIGRGSPAFRVLVGQFAVEP
jgi:hypothetical protein